MPAPMLLLVVLIGMLVGVCVGAVAGVVVMVFGVAIFIVGGINGG